MENNTENNSINTVNIQQLKKRARILMILNIVIPLMAIFIPILVFGLLTIQSSENGVLSIPILAVLVPYMVVAILLLEISGIYTATKLIKNKIMLMGVGLLIICSLPPLIVAGSIVSSKLRNTKVVQQMESFASERYDILFEKFKTPQKVRSIGANGVIDLECGINLVPIVDINKELPYGKIYPNFEKYAQENMIGKEVVVKLTDKEFFIKNYSPEWPGNYESFKAYVYFGDQIINLENY